MTLLPWMLYAVVITSVVGAAAWVLERSLLALRRPVRLVWLLALVAAVGLPLLALHGGGDGASSPEVVAAALSAGEGQPASAVSDRRLSLARQLLWPGTVLGSALTHGLDRAIGSLPFPSIPPERLVSFWLGGAGALLLLLLAGRIRIHRAAERWPTARVRGEQVRIAPETGPAVMGITRPWIVLPAWALGLAPERLRLVLLHEREHIAARDTLLLTGATLLTASCFWNPALWWLFRRLGAALEMDCDRRVLRYGVSRADYGALLIEVGSRSCRPPLSAAAMAEPTHLLERRLRHMRRSNIRHPILGLALAGAAALLLTVVACETEAPTTSVQEIPVEVSAETTTPGTVIGHDRSEEVPAPLVIVDGVILSGTLVEFELDPQMVSSIEVVKGEAARERYGERGRNGVIFITTMDAPEAREVLRLPFLRDDLDGGS
jgi:bla regulator protein blaR1